MLLVTDTNFCDDQQQQQLVALNKHYDGDGSEREREREEEEIIYYQCLSGATPGL